MRGLPLSLACDRYDRTAPLADGTVTPEGIELTYLHLQPAETFWRLTRYQEFDVSEMSLSGHIMRVARGDDAFVGLPVFTSRAFRHAGLYVRTDRGIETADDLRGRRLGVPEYHMTAALYMRGLLADESGIEPRDIEWVQAGQHEPGRVEREPLDLPDDIRVRPDYERTLDDLLRDGDVDGLTTPYVPAGFGDGGYPVRRLYADPLAAETEYYARTGIYPIMHLVVLRRDVHERHPWVARELVKAFERAKDVCLRRMEGIGGHSPSALPFFLHHLDAGKRLFGDDLWPYGIEANRPTLEAAVRYSHEQGLSERKVEVEELFAPSSQGGYRD